MTGLPKQCFHCYWNHHQHAFHWPLRELEVDPPQKDFLGAPQITSFPLCLVSITGAPRQVDIRSPCTRLSICTHSACLHAFLISGHSSMVLFDPSTEVRNIFIHLLYSLGLCSCFSNLSFIPISTPCPAHLCPDISVLFYSVHIIII